MKKPANKPVATKSPTPKQGQFLSFIHQYMMVNGFPPAELDIHRFFRVSPPTVHTMLVRLTRLGYISRVPGKARAITLLVPPESLPKLKRIY